MRIRWRKKEKKFVGGHSHRVGAAANCLWIKLITEMLVSNLPKI